MNPFVMLVMLILIILLFTWLIFVFTNEKICLLNRYQEETKILSSSFSNGEMVELTKELRLNGMYEGSFGIVLPEHSSGIVRGINPAGYLRIELNQFVIDVNPRNVKKIV